jgi:hypothetical protein
LFLTEPTSVVDFQVLSLPPVVAPTKVLIVPLSAKEEFDPLIQEVCTSFSRGRWIRHGANLTIFLKTFFCFASIEAAQGGHLFTRGRFEYLHRKAVRAE